MHARARSVAVAVAILAAGALAGCGDDASDLAATTTASSAAPTTTSAGQDDNATSTTSTAPATTAATTTLPTTTSEAPTTTPPTTETSADPVETTATTIPTTTSEAPMTTTPPATPQTELAIADLATRLSIDPSTITVVSVAEVTWSDGSLGCPEPGRVYTQALVNGTLIVLLVDGVEYEYHSGGGRDPFYCPPQQVLPPASGSDPSI